MSVAHTQLQDLHSRLLSLLSVEDCCIFGSSLDVWGHSCRIGALDFTFSLKPDDDSDIDVGLKDYKGIKDNTNSFGNRITVKKLDNRPVEVYDVIGNNLFRGVKYPYYSKEDGFVYADFEKALRMYIIRKFKKTTSKMGPSVPIEMKVLRGRLIGDHWPEFLKFNIWHSYDGVNFTKFTN
jgi:hypothetical protein